MTNLSQGFNAPRAFKGSALPQPRDTVNRQVVVFVRVDNMDSLEVEHQRTYVTELELEGDWPIDVAVIEGLYDAFERAKQEANG